MAKPAIQPHRGTPRAAHEKIAADLAWELGLAVPPVILWTDLLSGGMYSISAWACKQAEIWYNCKNSLTPAFKANCAQAIADITVFHSWIADTDRNEGNTLIDLESSEDAPKIYFIDHAFCFSYNPLFAQDKLNKVVHTYFPPDAVPDNLLAKTISAVENLTPAMVEGVVRRIPDRFLPAATADLTVAKLLGRKGVLRHMLHV